jgi:hypothetical protein
MIPSSYLILCYSRRIGPGIYIAKRELWLAISRLHWAYEIWSLPEEPSSLEEYDGESAREKIILYDMYEQLTARICVQIQKSAAKWEDK